MPLEPYEPQWSVAFQALMEEGDFIRLLPDLFRLPSRRSVGNQVGKASGAFFARPRKVWEGRAAATLASKRQGRGQGCGREARCLPCGEERGRDVSTEAAPAPDPNSSSPASSSTLRQMGDTPRRLGGQRLPAALPRPRCAWLCPTP